MGLSARQTARTEGWGVLATPISGLSISANDLVQPPNLYTMLRRFTHDTVFSLITIARPSANLTPPNSKVCLPFALLRLHFQVIVSSPAGL